MEVLAERPLHRRLAADGLAQVLPPRRRLDAGDFVEEKVQRFVQVDRIRRHPGEDYPARDCRARTAEIHFDMVTRPEIKRDGTARGERRISPYR